MPLLVETSPNRCISRPFPEAPTDNDESLLNSALKSENWEGALEALTANPIEAETWVVMGGGNDRNSYRFLPLHSACCCRPPVKVISALLEVYPDAASMVDSQGM